MENQVEKKVQAVMGTKVIFGFIGLFHRHKARSRHYFPKPLKSKT